MTNDKQPDPVGFTTVKVSVSQAVQDLIGFVLEADGETFAKLYLHVFGQPGESAEWVDEEWDGHILYRKRD